MTSFKGHLGFYILTEVDNANKTEANIIRISSTVTSTKEVMFCRCLFECLSVCLLATLRKNFRSDLHKIFRDDFQ